MAVAERSFAGYTYHQRLSSGVYGQVYRGLSGAGVEARILHVEPRLAEVSAFTHALISFGNDMPVLDHPRVVALRQVGSSGSEVLVVTDAVKGAVSVEQLLSCRGGRLPIDIALAIATGAIEGLSHAQSLGVVHGAVHPRSVLIDFHGGVRLSDFGPGWALAVAANQDDNRGLWAGLRGYLAPELALGQDPDARTDVYAAGALIHHLLAGQPPPGALAIYPTIRAVIDQALASDSAARLVNATELEELLEGAIIRAGARVAPADEVARFVTERLAAKDAGLQQDTDDLVAQLDGEPSLDAQLGSDPLIVATSGPGARALTDALAELDSSPGVDQSDTYGVPEPTEDFDSSAVTVLGDQLSETTQLGELTQVDHAPVESDPVDPISELVRDVPLIDVGARHPRDDFAERDATPLPEPTPHAPGSVTRHLRQLEQEDQAIRAAQGKSNSALAMADTTDVSKQWKEVMAAGEARPATAPPHPAGDLIGLAERPGQLGARSGARTFVWLLLTAAAVGGLAAFLYTQTELFNPGREQAEQAERERARARALAAHTAAQASAGELVITSSEADAAVWLLLGTTPMGSFPLSSAMVHELRIEHEGYRPFDQSVTGYQWKGDGGDQVAQVRATLEPGDATGVPPYPAAPPSPPPAGPKGRGILNVTSEPDGAEVWLLIGFTPRVSIHNLPAGRGYEIKVLKDGFVPGFGRVAAEEWYLSGTSGPMHSSIERTIELDAVAKPRKSAGKKPRKKRRRRP